MKEFWVEYDFVETNHGCRPNLIRVFKNKVDADAFAESTVDGKVVEINWAVC